MQQLLLGVDVGTTATKAVLVDNAGHIISQGRAEYPTKYLQAGWVEQDPNDWWAHPTAKCRAVAPAPGPAPARAAARLCPLPKTCGLGPRAPDRHASAAGLGAGRRSLPGPVPAPSPSLIPIF